MTPPFLRSVAALALALLHALAAAADELIELPNLGGSSYAFGISSDGTYVVGGSNSQPYRWNTDGGMTGLGLPGGVTAGTARAVSNDGNVVVGTYQTTGFGSVSRAIIWRGGAITVLGTLPGHDISSADAVSADGSVVVGNSYTSGPGTRYGFRWTEAGGMTALSPLAGGTSSTARAISADGSRIAGWSLTGGYQEATLWVDSVPQGLGRLPGHVRSEAYAISADGTTVVGRSTNEAFSGPAVRWTEAGGMQSLGTLPGHTHSYAWAVSADGSVIVGRSETGGDLVAVRWTGYTGMQSVVAWLHGAGVTSDGWSLRDAYGVSVDGSVVVGYGTHNGQTRAFIARVAAVGSGLVTLADVQQSLAASATGGSMALSTASTVLNGAHSHPLARRVPVGQRVFWVAGDWSHDEHGSSNGNLGLAEFGFGRNLGAAQVNLSLGHTWANQNLTLGGGTEIEGTYLLAEMLIPVAGNLWVVVGGYRHWADADLRRGYLNAGNPAVSTGNPDMDTWGLRARLEWDRALRVARTELSPYLDLSYVKTKLAGYTETGGGFPARFDARTENATELRLGVNGVWPLASGARLLGMVEAAHRFEKQGARTSGELIGLFGFDLDGQKNKREWLRAGAGVEGNLAGGTASLMLNVTSKGEPPSAWLAANWQKAF